MQQIVALLQRANHQNNFCGTKNSYCCMLTILNTLDNIHTSHY